MKLRRATRRCLLLSLLVPLVACGAYASVPVAVPKITVVAAGPDRSPTAVPTTLRPTTTPRPTVAPATPTLVPTATTVPASEPTSEPTTVPTPEAPTALPDQPEPTPDPNLSRATGERIFARGTIRQRPWMVMIDNHPDAYPQSGLDSAAVVFEGLAEYGVTRFVALYADGITPETGEIGPVRSTRLYFAQWAIGFHPVYAYAGGSPDGIALAEATDQLVHFDALRELSYVWRDEKRSAPHNLYTSSELLRRFAGDKAVQKPVDAENGYLFEALPPADVPTATAIDYFFLDRGSRAGFRYDASSNGYERVMRDTAHRDRVTGEQLWTRNVVVMQVSEAARQDDPKQRIDQQVVGSGDARVFMSGRELTATWRKDAEAAPLRFYDGAGQELVFNAGPIWIAAIPTFERLTVK